MRRRLLLISTVLVLAAAALVAIGVIPDVWADEHPGAAPKRAAPAFWVNVGLNLAAAVACAVLAFGARARRKITTVVLHTVGIVVLLLGLALIDAGTAFLDHDPWMTGAVPLMFVGAAADILAAALVIASVYALRREDR